MNVIKSILLLILCSSAFGQVKNNKQDIVITEPTSKKTKIPKTWKSLNVIQKEWIKVERDEKGYLIYDPCDGATPTIKLEKGYLVINSGFESEKFSYEKFTRLTDNNAFRLDVGNPETKTSFEVKAKIIDYKNGIVLWEFSSVRWLMTPAENKNSFRNIQNNCPKGKKKELKFLPIKETEFSGN